MIFKTRPSSGALALAAVLGFVLVCLAIPPALLARTALAPGGFLEAAATTIVRPKLTAAQVQGFLPSRGTFTFPAPYNTQGVRLTNASDCAGATDCVQYVGYSYWNNINNSAGANDMFIFLGLDKQKGGVGPSLFSFNKVTGQTVNLGPLFDSASSFSWASGEGWYFSATLPTKLYVSMPTGSQFFRYDVLAHTFEPIFDVVPQYGADKFIWQLHSSSDDKVHSFTLRTNTNWGSLGCGAYREDTRQWYYFPARGDFDECQIDKSGRYLIIKENVDGLNGEDNVVEDLQAGTEQILLDQNGAAGHSDVGFGYMVAEDNFFLQPSAVRLWNLGTNLNSGTNGALVSVGNTWYAATNHIAHGNSVSGLPASQQYVCSSQANRLDLPHANEVVCYMLDGKMQQLVVAPVMTNLDAAGGTDDYGKDPKANLDPTGQFVIWTSNTGGSRLDAFLAWVPSQLLVGATQPPPDTTRPTVSISTPANGAVVSGISTVLASASDNVGVVGVQFELDGANLGPEITASPFGVSWTTTATPDGAHTLTAVARDAAGNMTVAAPISVTVQNSAVSSLTVSNVGASSLTNASASIGWATNLAADSQVDYGPTSAYGSSTTIDSTMVMSHTEGLAGLAASTTYHYRVRSRSSGGSTATSADATFSTPASGSPLTSVPVLWTSLVNTTATLGSLQKTSGCDGCQDAGAISQQQIASGDGYVEFTTAETQTFRFVGLSNGNPGTTGNEIRFAFRLQSGTAEIRESGTYKAETPIVPGDILRVAAVGGKIQYSKNGTLVYTSTLAPAYPMIVDTMLAGVGGTVANAVISVPPALPTTGWVQWTNKVNVTVSGTTLKKTGGCNGCQDAGATSAQQIVGGDGYFEFTIDDTNSFRFIGLSNGNPGTTGNEIKFAWRLQSGRAEVRESGVYCADTSIKKNDVLRVAVVGGKVVYTKNKAVIYTSAIAPAYPLIVDAMLAGLNGTLSQVIISGSLAAK